MEHPSSRRPSTTRQEVRDLASAPSDLAMMLRLADERGSSAALAVQPPATILVPLEAVFGQFYIAVVVAKLVGARLSQQAT